ncbi:MAG: flagellar biosynthesis protein FlhF [Phycisphaeraceae bacterium]|nr:flagellar biosynthesis protein FlhF [Phycisphaeraceae bacterium]
MKLKTFSADTMAQALAKVKREIGADAVILHTRSYKRGGLFGIGARTVVEVTAADGRQVGKVNRRKAQNSPRRAALRQASVPVDPPTIKLPAAPPVMPPIGEVQLAGDLIKRTYAAAKVEIEQRQQQQQLAAAVTVAPMPADHLQLVEEMRAVKRLVQRAIAPSTDKVDARQLPDALFDQYRALLEQEVAQEIADEVVHQVRGRLDDEQLEDHEACRAAVLEAVKALLPKSSGLAEANSAQKAKVKLGKPRTIALVGPTGVGKTTTIAKLAANFKLRENRRVGLVTLDTYRIAAVEQLRTYAEIIGVPLRIVTSGGELSDAIASMADCDVVLIDTAGRSQRNDQRLNELSQILEKAAPDEVHLVLSSTCTQKVLLEVAERFSIIRTDRVIFTKLDEAVTFGVLVNVLRKVNKQLSYVTTGQEVPHQIEPGDGQRLAQLVLGGEGPGT